MAAWWCMLSDRSVQVIKSFWVQFRINKQKEIFLRQSLQKIAQARRAKCNLVSLKNSASTYWFQIAWEKSFDYLLIIYKWQFLSRFNILCDKWSVKLLQLYWKKIWRVMPSVKPHWIDQLWYTDLNSVRLKFMFFSLRLLCFFLILHTSGLLV